MVESSAGAPCRCACQGTQCSEEPSACCSPHVFTSALLGALACVLMTGGVFLAFHRWDPLWLIVSAVGVVLVLIGSLLHCFGAREARASRRAALGPKGCCGRPMPDAHVIPNGGSLTEQLLPLSNARSVSQLSLNMLPGYFPPVVTTYGIEQHSAVVQNINRIVQQQQQQQQQQPPQSPCSLGPSMANGKSFILLSLPGDTPPANIQNLVATVYQLDGNVVTEIPATEGTAQALPLATPSAAPAPPPILKNAEVQTCSAWTSPSGQPVPGTSSDPANATPEPQPSTSTQMPEVIDLLDCSPICDTLRGNDTPASVLVPVRPDLRENLRPVPESSNFSDLPTEVLVQIPASDVRSDVGTSDVLVDISVEPSTSRAGTCLPQGLANSARSDVTEACVPRGLPNSSISDAVEGHTSPQGPAISSRSDTSEERTSSQGPVISSRSDTPEGRTSSQCPEISSRSDTSEGRTSSQCPEISSRSDTSEACAPSPQGLANNGSSNNCAEFPPEASQSDAMDESIVGAVGGGSELSLSLSDIEMDDGELLERSSPPPSYDDVTLEGGLGYGTI